MYFFFFNVADIMRPTRTIAHNSTARKPTNHCASDLTSPTIWETQIICSLLWTSVGQLDYLFLLFGGDKVGLIRP